MKEPQPGQTRLFEADPFENRIGLAHRTAADTERAAAAAVAPNSGTQRGRIYLALRRAGAAGLTDWEIVEGLGILRSSVCGRRNELLRDDLIKDSGRRRVERTGHKAIVWVAVR